MAGSARRASTIRRGSTAQRVFVVDPIDGTRGFIKGEDSWCVCLAVVEDGLAVAGVVYAPARDEMYEASIDGGARLNGRPILRRTPPDRHAPLIPAPGAVHHELQEVGLEYTRGSALPLARLPAGAGRDRTARCGGGPAWRRNDWDIAAAAIILAEAGIAFEDVCEEQMLFNKADVRHGALAASGAHSLKTVLHDALRRVYGCPSPAEMPVDLERKTP